MKSHFSIAFSLTTLLLALSVSTPAQALIELKGGYSLHTVAPSELNDTFAAYPKIDGLESISADVTTTVPLIPFGLGIRYETIKKTVTSGANSSKVDWTRTSVLMNKRWIDTLFYIGPIATISVTNDFKYTTDNGTDLTYKTANPITGTVGFEAGAKLMVLRLGGEVGYMYAPMGEIKNSSGTTVVGANGSAINVDMSGVYYRATIGFGF